MQPSSTNTKRFGSRLFKWFIEADPAIKAEADRQSARIVSGLLLFLVFMLASATINAVPAGSLAFLLTVVGYGLSRTRYYQVGGIVAVIALTIPSMIAVLTAETEVISQFGRATQLLAWLVVMLVLVSLWAKGWVTGVTTAILVIMALSLLFIRPEINTVDVGVLASLYGLSGGLLALGAGLRNRYVRQIEQQAGVLQNQQAQIQSNEQRYRELVENISDVVYRIDTKGYFTYVSPAAAVITGYTGEALVGTHFTELVESSYRQQLIDFYVEQIESRQLETVIDFPIITAEGAKRWVEQKTSLRFDESGKPNGFQSIVRDITERKQTEEKLQALYTVMAQPNMTIDQQLQQALKIGTEILGLDLGIISQIQGDTYTVLYGHSPDNSLQAGQTFDFKQTYCDLAYRVDELVTIEHMANSQYSGHPCYSAFGLESYIGVPIKVGAERFGTLNFSSATPRAQSFAVVDVDFFELMGQWVSTMLERKLAESRLQQSETNLRSIIDSSPSIITRASRDCRIEFTRLPGIEPALLEQVVGQSFLSFMPEEFRDVARQSIERVFDEKISTQYEASAIDPRDNSVRWYVTSVAPIIEDGEVVSALLVNNDITERREAELVIQRSQEQMRQVADGLNGAIYQFSALGDQWQMDYISDGVEKLAGVSAGEAMADIASLINIFHPEDLPLFLQAVNDVVRQRGETFFYEGRLTHQQTGEIRWVRAESRLEVDIEDRAVFKGVLLDITERRRFEESLRLNTRAVETSPNGIVIADVQQPDMPLIYVNPAFEQITGYSADEIIGQNCRFLQADDKDQPALNVLRSAIKNGKDCVVILRNYRKDGTMFWNELSLNPIFDDRGVMTHFLGIQSDITGRKLAEQQVQTQNESLVRANRELAVARKQAETASKLKSQFLATMSHELRTPLNAVIGYAQLQIAGMVGELTDEQYSFQERILANAQHLLMLINEVLDLSKIEAGRLELLQRPFNLRDCLDAIVQQNRILADDKGLAFELNFDDRLPETVVGDEGRIKQIIINLVSNAIKFTDSGTVTIDTVLYNKDSWRVTVTDTGIGIPPHLQETIFDEFRQAETGMERGGTGLGLAIVRKLVLMMGGNIRLNSEVGRGSESSFEKSPIG